MANVAWKKREIKGSVLERAACASCTYGDRYVLIFGGRQRDAMFLDAWSYDTVTGDLVLLSPGPRSGKARPRAHHSATLVGDRVWILGGNVPNAFCGERDAWTFDVRTREWAQPALTGDVHLLRRTAHGACVHPAAPGAILLFGGYGLPGPAAGDPLWLGDLVTVDTRTGEVRGVRAGGKAPLPRAYHSFSAVGPLAVALFGRTTQQQLIPGPHAVAVYDTRSGKWVAGGAPAGEAPPARSSHRAAELGGGRLALFGGSAAQPLGHLDDMRYLKVEPGAAAGAVSLAWEACEGPAGPRRGRGGGGAPWPPPRSAHVMECAGGKVYLLGGYSKTKNYCGDAWEGEPRGAASAAASTPPAAAAAVAVAEAVMAAVEMAPAEPDVAAVPWRTTRHARKAAPAAAAPEAAAAKRRRLSEGSSEAMPPPPPPAAWARVHPPSGPEPVAVAAALMAGAGAVPPCAQGAVTAAVAAAEAGAATRLAVQLAEAREERERAMRDLQAQRAKEAELLKAVKAAEAQAKRLQGQLASSDESWRAAAAERDAWRAKFDDRCARADNAEARALKLERSLAASNAKVRAAEQHVAAVKVVADQQRRAVEDAGKRESALQAEAAGLGAALETREREIAAEKDLRTTLAEQNDALVAQRDEERRRRERAEAAAADAREEARRAADAAGAEADRQRAAAAERDKALDRAAAREEEAEAAKTRAVREEARARTAEEERAAAAREAEATRARAERAEREVARLKEAAEDGERQTERQFAELIDLAAKFKRAHTYGAAAGPSRV